MKEQDYAMKLADAIRSFWTVRTEAGTRQAEGELADRGERAAVTSGKHLDALVDFFRELVEEAGVAGPRIGMKVQMVTLPGFFRPTKKWDMLVNVNDHLVAALELKSHIGPSFGNNVNNRVEEALGSATDFWTAFREGAFGQASAPFLGYMILVEDCPEVHKLPGRPVRSSYFNVRDEFLRASYAERYRLMCEKLVREKLYTAAALMLSPRTATVSGEWRQLSELSGMSTFVRGLRAAIQSHVEEDGAQIRVDVGSDSLL